MANLKRHLPMSVTIAIIVHVIAIILLVVGYQIKQEHHPSPKIKAVKAKVINTEKLAEEKRKIQEKEKQQKILEEQRIKAEQEKKRLQAEIENEKKKAEEAKKIAEQERKKAEEAKRVAEAKQKELEKKRIEEEARIKAEQAKKLAEEKKRKEEQEKIAQEQAAIEKERLAKLEQEEKELIEAELEAQRIAKAREMNKFIAQYQEAIRSKIQSNWRKPLNEQSDAWCKIFVRQTPGGYIESVEIEQCNGDDAFRTSVKNAVLKSDPLPAPPIPELFDRELRFKFIPET